MKKYWLTATTLGAIAALSLSACGASDEATDSTPTASTSTAAATGALEYGGQEDVDILKAVTWNDADEQPALDFEAPITVTGAASYVNAEGDGDEIAEGNNVELDIVVVSGTDGSNLGSTYDSGTPETYLMSEASIDPALYNVLVGNRVGQTLIYATPDSTATVEEGEDTPAVLYAVTAVSATEVAERASGTTVDPAAGLPAVTLADDGAPSVDFTGVEMPTELVAQTLIEGDGAEVTAEQTITAHYTGWIWDGDVFDSSWEGGTPMTIPLAQVVAGWQQGLAGQKVGSQVLLVIPPELGYGDEESGSIPAGSTLVFVVDILAAS